MKLKSFLLLTVTALLALASPAPAADATAKRGSLVHMVSFKFKEGAPREQVQAVETAFAALPKKISEIASFEWGTDVSPEKLSKGFTHCFILTFRTEKDRDAYLVHPAHKDFVKIVGPALAESGAFVIDFWAK